MRIFLLIFLFLSGCAANSNQQQEMDWKGKSVNTLTSRLGQPDFIGRNRAGNKIYSYSTMSNKEYSLPTSNPSTIALPNGQAVAANIPPLPSGKNSGLMTCISMFEVNEQGVIVSVKMQGGGCFR